MKSESPARRAAFHILKKTLAGKYAEDALNEYFLTNRLISKDKSLATEIVYGAMRRRNRLDGIIQRSLNDPSKKINPDARLILIIALYQLIFLDRVPQMAAVNEAAIQARALLGAGAVGFINGVLRSFLREQNRRDPAPTDDPDSLAEYFSHPVWLVRKLIDRYGLDYIKAWLAFNNTVPDFEVRVNPIKLTKDDLLSLFLENGIDAQTHSSAAQTLILKGIARDPGLLPGFREGFFSVQSVGSQLIVPLLKVRAGDSVLDACAAPGGKTAQIGASTSSVSITAIEKNKFRLKSAQENLTRLEVSALMIWGDAADPKLLDQLEQFDKILVDAPCSTLGVLRRNPESKYRVRATDPNSYARAQLKLLTALGSKLKKGGILLYSVCTVTQEETHGVVAKFLKIRSEFKLSPIEPHESVIPGSVGDGYLDTFACMVEQRVDGFFAARFVKSA